MPLHVSSTVVLIIRRSKVYYILLHSVIQKDWLNFICLYFPNYTRYVNDLHDI